MRYRPTGTFLSNATDLLAAADGNGLITDAFLRDLAVPSTKLISTGSIGQSNGSADQLSLSADGSKALFRTSGALALIDTGFYSDCYMRDWLLDTTVLASLKDDDSRPSGNTSLEACAFAGANTVYFLSAANDIVTATDEASSVDLFKRELAPVNTTTHITAGDVDRLGTNLVVASDDRLQAGFFTFDSTLIPGATFDFAIYSSNSGGYSSLNVDRRDNQIERNLPADASISQDGSAIAFVSTSANLVSNKRTNLQDVFVRDRARRSA